MEKIRSTDTADCIVGFSDRIVEGSFAPRSLWDFQLFENERAFREGKVKDTWQCSNLVTNEGKDAVNNIMFSGSTQITAWYLLLFNTATDPAAAMTYAVPVFTESSAYTEATRPAWVEAGSASRVISNLASRAVFTMDATTTIYGCALVGGGSAASTKANVAGGGTLYCVSRFAVAKDVIATNILYVGVSISQL